MKMESYYTCKRVLAILSISCSFLLDDGVTSVKLDSRFSKETRWAPFCISPKDPALSSGVSGITQDWSKVLEDIETSKSEVKYIDGVRLGESSIGHPGSYLDSLDLFLPRLSSGARPPHFDRLQYLLGTGDELKQWFHLKVKGRVPLEGLLVQGVHGPLGVPFGSFGRLCSGQGTCECSDCPYSPGFIPFPCTETPMSAVQFPDVYMYHYKHGSNGGHRSEEIHMNFHYLDLSCSRASAFQFLLVGVKSFGSLDYQVLKSVRYELDSPVSRDGIPYPFHIEWRHQLLCHHGRRPPGLTVAWSGLGGQGKPGLTFGDIASLATSEYDSCIRGWDPGRRPPLGCPPGPFKCSRARSSSSPSQPSPHKESDQIHELLQRSIGACSNIDSCPLTVSTAHPPPPPPDPRDNSEKDPYHALTRDFGYGKVGVPPELTLENEKLPFLDGEPTGSGMSPGAGDLGQSKSPAQVYTNRSTIPVTGNVTQRTIPNEFGSRPKAEIQEFTRNMTRLRVGRIGNRVVHRAHGIMMFFGWSLPGCLSPFLSRFMKETTPGIGCGGKGIWLWAHVLLSLVSLTGMWAGILLLGSMKFEEDLSLGPSWVRVSHGLIGGLAILLHHLNFLTGWVRPVGNESRNLWIIVHVLLGYGGKFVAIGAVFLSRGQILYSPLKLGMVTAEVLNLIFYVTGTRIQKGIDSSMRVTRKICLWPEHKRLTPEEVKEGQGKCTLARTLLVPLYVALLVGSFIFFGFFWPLQPPVIERYHPYLVHPPFKRR